MLDDMADQITTAGQISSTEIKHAHGSAPVRAMPPNAELRADRAAYHQGRQPSVRACNPALGIVELPLELAEGGLVDPGGRLNGGPRNIATQKPLDGHHLTLQLAFSAAPFDPLFDVIHHFSSALLRAPVRAGAARR